MARRVVGLAALALGACLACSSSTSSPGAATAPAERCGEPPRSEPPALDPRPEKLGAQEIKDATDAMKSHVLCACKPPARGGELISLRGRIAGESGEILELTHEDGALERCAAEPLRQVRFPSFAAAEQGFMISIRFP
ncbi:MAG: hypothetical protein H6711_26520 [Myxococcales bacterium]|nr:hypothetical protein [Myxococcales bacterium]